MFFRLTLFLPFLFTLSCSWWGGENKTSDVAFVKTSDVLKGKKKSDVLTVVVKEALNNEIKVMVGNEKLVVPIKKNQLAEKAEDARPSRFAKGDKIDAMITELNLSKRKVSLSIKALEEKQTKEAVKKYGSEDSGASLGDILGKVLKRKK